MIKLQVIGNLGRDAATNVVNGKSVINFSVAHTERYKDASGMQKEKTTWVDCAYWTDRTAVAPYLKKGTQVYVEGTPDVRSYAKQDGTQGAALTMRVLNVQLLGGNRQEQGSNGNGSASGFTPYTEVGGASLGSPAPVSYAAPVEDDLPF